MIFLYVILGILGFCFLLWLLYQCSESDEDDEIMKRVNNHTTPSENQNERQENNSNTNGENKHMTPSLTPGEANGNQHEMQKSNFNSAAINMPAKPDYKAHNNFPSNIQTNTYGTNNHMPPSSNLPYSLGESIGNQNERQENNFSPGLNPAFNPTFNPAAIEMPPNPEYEARNNFPSNFQTNNYGANNPITPSSNLPYSLTPGEANGNQNGSEPAYAGGWVNQS